MRGSLSCDFGAGGGRGVGWPKTWGGGRVMPFMWEEVRGRRVDEFKGWRWASMVMRAMVVGEGGGGEGVMVGDVEARVGAVEAGEGWVVVLDGSSL